MPGGRGHGFCYVPPSGEYRATARTQVWPQAFLTAVRCQAPGAALDTQEGVCLRALWGQSLLQSQNLPAPLPNLPATHTLWASAYPGLFQGPDGTKSLALPSLTKGASKHLRCARAPNTRLFVSLSRRPGGGLSPHHYPARYRQPLGGRFADSGIRA